MGISPIPGVPGAPFLVIFTDLDGTLLDYTTYEWREAMPALNACKGLEIPVILVSSKTRAEMDLLRRSMSLSDPFISENGGGIFFPRETFKTPPPEATAALALEAQKAHRDEGLWQWSLGLPYPDLIKGLQDLREELGWHIRGFSDMSIEEISYLTGLDIERASLAAMREFDEPFVVLDQEEPNLDALSEAVVKRGLRVSSGGRLYHLQGKNDKGVAVERLISWYGGGQRKIISIVLGDSPNDFPMLELADFPVLVRSGQEYPALKEKVPRLKVTRDMGPSGWNSAVLEILRGERGERGNG